jgi:hypothetical protein
MLTALILISAVGVSAQQATLKGVVLDSETRRPIPLVNIYMRGTSVGTTTDDSGEFTLSIPGGEKQTIAFSHIGYRKSAYEVELDSGTEFDASVELEPDILQMGEVVISAPKIFFEQTASYTVTEEQIERYRATNLYDVLRRYTPQLYHTVSPLAMLRGESGFTLYVDSFPWDTKSIEAIDPYSVKKIYVWRRSWAPMSYRMNSGSQYLVEVITR